MRRLSLAQARRIAIAAQGLARPRPEGRVDIRHLRRVLDHVKLIQIDSVNAVARSHRLALFSRLGAYPDGLLRGAVYRRRELFECWAHEASYVPVAHYPLLRHRMEESAGAYSRRERALHEAEPGYFDRVLAEIAEGGPLAASELTDAGDRAGPWWGWSKGKIACEHLFAAGRLAIAERRGFTRVYDLPERVLPPAVLDAPAPAREPAYEQLLLLAAEAHGVGTAGDLADYHRLHRPTARGVVERLAAQGRLEPVEVEGWPRSAYLHPQAGRPRRVTASALLSPFDPLVWERARAERLFGFRYRLEIYVPADRRVHGYYVLPFLLGERLVARVDLKADRAASRLLVRASWAEPGVEHAAAAAALAAELRTLAGWLALGEIEVTDRGELAPALRRLM